MWADLVAMTPTAKYMLTFLAALGLMGIAALLLLIYEWIKLLFSSLKDLT